MASKKYLVCSWCNEPRQICTCRHMPFALSTLYKYPNEGASLVKIQRPIGVEIELSDWGSVDAAMDSSEAEVIMRSGVRYIKAWDRSVEPSHHEMVLGPMARDTIVKVLQNVCLILQKNRAQVNGSCSVHTHVDARDCSMWDIRAFVLLYLQWQDEFNRMFDPKRVLENRSVSHDGYAKSYKGHIKDILLSLEDAKSTKTIKTILASALYNVRDINYDATKLIVEKNKKYVENRYYGVNLHAFMSMGTLEFRHHEGALDAGLICWPLFCLYYMHKTAQAAAWNKWRGRSFNEFTAAILPEVIQEWCKKREKKYQEAWAPVAIDSRAMRA